MNTDQVIEGIGKAVAAAKPAQEYCFLGSNWSPLCLPLPDWFGGLGLFVSVLAAIGTVGAVIVSLRLARKSDVERSISDARRMRMHSLFLLPVLEGFRTDLQHSSVWVYFVVQDSTSTDDVWEGLRRAKKWAVDFESHSALGPLSTESLLMLPEVVSYRISRALGLLHAVRIEISRFNPDEWGNKAQAISAKAKEWADAQSIAKDFISVAIQELRKNANPEAIHPSGQELYGDADAD